MALALRLDPVDQPEPEIGVIAGQFRLPGDHVQGLLLFAVRLLGLSAQLGLAVTEVNAAENHDHQERGGRSQGLRQRAVPAAPSQAQGQRP